MNVKTFFGWGKFILTLVSAVIAHGSYSAVISSKPVSGSISIGQFESPNLTAGQFEYTPVDANWTFASSGISENSGGFTGANPNAPQGTQVAFIQVNILCKTLNRAYTSFCSRTPLAKLIASIK